MPHFKADNFDRCKTKAIQSASDICRVDKMFPWLHILADYVCHLTYQACNVQSKSLKWKGIIFSIHLLPIYLGFSLLWLPLLGLGQVHFYRWLWLMCLFVAVFTNVIPWAKASAVPPPSVRAAVPVSIERRIIGSFMTPGPHSSRRRDKSNQCEPWPLRADHRQRLPFKKPPWSCAEWANVHLMSLVRSYYSRAVLL